MRSATASCVLGLAFALAAVFSVQAPESTVGEF